MFTFLNPNGSGGTTPFCEGFAACSQSSRDQHKDAQKHAKPADDMERQQSCQNQWKSKSPVPIVSYCVAFLQHHPVNMPCAPSFLSERDRNLSASFAGKQVSESLGLTGQIGECVKNLPHH